ncbi:class F sortase [Kribbella sp. NBC_00889]|uniref:class F sortase n=1 Tax=Kribbella sp. NBC_00889 TaxID=2975974 RepID=UPI00386DAE0D|nr:class F sortase [Kribbella sp. NBC_00889]
MSSARRRGRRAPLRWSGAVAIVGAGVLVAGAYLQFNDDAGTSPSPTGSPSPAAAVAGRSNGAVAEPPRAASSSAATTSSTGRVPAARAGRPTSLTIAQLDVKAPVIAIKAAHGALTPPSDPSTVGWWSGGAQPGGARGSAVITGHTVHNGGGAFDKLDQLVPGSVVVASTVRGQLRYRVASVTTYRKAALAKRATQLFDQRVRARLVLVTCEDWNGKVYLSNVVVIALPIT